MNHTLAHISDLHLGRDRPTDAAARRLVAALLEADVGAVLVTGDVTHRGRRSELDAFERTFAPLRDRTIVVPGNHDRLGDDAGRGLMGPARVAVQAMPGLHVVRLDSTAPHNRALLQSHGELSADDIAAVDSAVEVAPPGALVAVMLHHHLLPLPEDHLSERIASLLGWPNAAELSLGRRLLERLRGRCDLVLHGHRHTPGGIVLAPRAGRSLHVMNAGSTPELGCARLLTHSSGRLVSERWLEISAERPRARAFVRSASRPPRPDARTPRGRPAVATSRRHHRRSKDGGAPMRIDSSFALFIAAAIGLVAIALQCAVLRRHVRHPAAAPHRAPPISILKPLCGVDDGLETNLASFAALAYPDYEVVLGVRSVRDAAFDVARAAARRWPGRFRVAVQRGEPGLNPKVNQLITLARAARHGILVVSDSNVRVEGGYLAEIAALLEDDRVGLVTHPITGVGELRAGSLMDHLHLAGSITPGVVAAKRLAGRDIVVGKSMALRRDDLDAMGGFEAVKDVLAEDYVMGLMVGDVLGKRVAVARRPIQNVSERRSVGEFAARYRRWAVLQRQAVGPFVYAAQALLNPVLVASVATALDPTPAAAALLTGTCVAKAALDGAAARALRPGGFRLAQLALVPVKDVVFGAAWAFGLARREVTWRGTRLVVRRGTRIEAPLGAGPHLAGVDTVASA